MTARSGQAAPVRRQALTGAPDAPTFARLSDPEPLPSALVQEADCAEAVVVLKLRAPGLTSWVIVAAPAGGAARAGLLPQGSRQRLWGGRLPPGATRQRAREDALVGARVLALGDAEAWIDQHGTPRVIRAERGRVVVTDGCQPSELAPFVLASSEQRAAWETRGLAVAQAVADASIEVARADVTRMLGRARARLERRREAVRADLSKVADADRIAAQAQWLVGEAARAPRGATKLVVTDWSTGEPVLLEVPLDPAKGAREQVEAMFKRAKRLRLGAHIAEERLARTEEQLLAVEIALEAVAKAGALAAIDEAAREAKRAAPRDVVLERAAGAASSGPARDGGPKGRVAFRTFLARSGRKLLVGKGAADNDALTLHVARPHDLWLHAKERTGAHVVVQLDKGHTCPGEDLVDAAHLAAHFSDAREEAVVDVQYTPRRHLRKPKGSGPGFVLVDREKVLALRVDPARVRELLEREQTS